MGERLFNPQNAHKLDDPERRLWMPVADVIRESGIRPGMRVADIGAGTGYFAIPIAHAVGPNGKVYAVDLQSEMLEMLREKLKAPETPRNLELVQGEASQTNLPSRCADFVLIANVWHELEDPAGALREVARILAPAGTIGVLDWRPEMSSPPGPPPDHRLAAADVLQSFVKNGWGAAQAINIGRYSYFITATPPRIEPDGQSSGSQSEVNGRERI